MWFDKRHLWFNKGVLKRHSALFTLLLKNLIRLKFPFIYVFIITPIFIYLFMLLGDVLHVYTYTEDFIDIRNNFMSGLLIAGLPIALNIMPLTIQSFRTSAMSDKLSVSPISKIEYLFINLLFYFLLLIVVTFWNLIWVVIFNLDKLDLIFGSNLSVTVNWVGFLISLFITHALYIIIGLSIALTFKNNITGQVIGTLLNVVSIVFSGQVIPIHMLDSNQILEVISYISPFRYSTGLLHMSWNYSTMAGDVANGGIFNPHLPYQIPIDNAYWFTVFWTYDIWLCWFMPLVYGIVLLIATRIFFNWKS